MMDTAGQVADPEWKQLLHLGEQLVNQPTPAAQCDRIAEVIGKLLSARVRVWLASPFYPVPGTPAMETLPDAPATELVHRAWAERKSQCDPQPPQNESPSDGGPVAAAVPMMINENLIGVVQADRPDGQPFSARDLSLLEGLVAHAATAMEVTRQEKIEKWRLEQLSLVRSVSGQIARLTKLDELYRQVTHLIQKTFNYYYVAIFALDQEQGVLRFQGSASQNNSTPLSTDFVTDLDQGIIGAVAKTGTEIVAPDVRQDARYRYLEVLPETQSEAALPLKIENQILGVLDVQSDRLNAFHETDMVVLQSLADNIAIAIQSMHLYENLERRAEQISSVFDVSHALSSILNPDDLLNEVVRVIQNRFGYPFVHLYTVHMGRKLAIYQTGTGARSEAMKSQGKHYSLDDPQGIIPWVVRNGKTFMANDVTSEPIYRPADLPPYDTRSELTVPLMVGDEVLGVLDIQSLEKNAFDENDRSLFEALAAPIAIAIRNANLYRSEQWRRRVAESFRDVAHLISTNQPINHLLNLILEKLEEILPCDASAIWLVQEDPLPSPQRDDKLRLRLAATRNLDIDRIFEVLQNPQTQEMLEDALERDQPSIRRPDSPMGPLGAALNLDPGYSSIAAPMRTSKGPLGILTLAHHQTGRYGSEAQAITATFASYAAVAIQNARLYSEAQEQALISTMLLQVAEASQTIMTVDDLLSTMVRLTRLLVGVKKCAFLFWEEGLQSFELKAWYGFEPTGPTPWLLHAELPAFSQLIEKRSTLYLDDPGIELNLPELRLSPEPGTTVMLPLIVRGEVIGAFVVALQMASITEPDPGFDPKALAILQGIAHQTSITVDNLRLLEARQEEAYITAALLQVAQAVVSMNDLNDTLDTIVQLLPILVGIETCVIYLWDASRQLFRPTQVSARSRQEEETILSRSYAPGEHQLLDAIQQTGEVQMCQILDSNLPFEDWAGLPCHSYEEISNQSTPPQGDWLLGYPLSLQGHVLGAMMVRESAVSPAFWEQRMEIINGIAQQTSLAIQNDLLKTEMVQTERIEREIQLARQIQETFLPNTLPQLEHWELDVRWETARQVGGDFYDVFKIGENKISLVIADVSDKGLPAALYMTVARTLIRAYAAENRSPAEVLQEVNELLVNESSESMFITAVYAVLSLDTGELVYTNAGHNLPLIYHARTGEVQPLKKGGMALGIFNNIKLTDHTLKIKPGELLILYTDGVTDLLSPDGDVFGERRLYEIIQDKGKESVEDLLEALDDALLEFRRGVPPADDITLLALRRQPAARKQKQERTEDD
ncbi:MAG: GAF domain-containing protein [Chloroflexi bacterium]|nr:GAF domain-containing protein [Chloroflexota bacterium]